MVYNQGTISETNLDFLDFGFWPYNQKLEENIEKIFFFKLLKKIFLFEKIFSLSFLPIFEKKIAQKNIFF